MASEKMKLTVWRGDWGLPSVDPHCLAVLAYCKFSGIPVEVVKTGNPWHSPSGNFPVLCYRRQTYAKVSDIFSFFRKESWGSDLELSAKQNADVVAFSAMLDERLLPALLHLWWMDDKTFIDVTRPWYANAIPFPLSLFHPRRKQKKAELRVLLTKGGDYITDAETEAKVYKEAKECLNLLSYKLGDKPYMFGRLPSSLDALIFGYLAPLLKAPLPGNQLQTHLLQCDNLCRMCNDILTVFFPADVKESNDSKRQSDEKKKQSGSKGDVSEFPHRRRNIILAAIFAITAMIGYAFAHGLIQITISDVDSSVVVKPASSPKSGTTDLKSQKHPDILEEPIVAEEE